MFDSRSLNVSPLEEVKGVGRGVYRRGCKEKRGGRKGREELGGKEGTKALVFCPGGGGKGLECIVRETDKF